MQRTKNLRQPWEGLRETNIEEGAVGFQEIKSIGMSRISSSMTGWDITWFPPKGFRTTAKGESHFPAPFLLPGVCG